jgi:hypothetical protein
MAACPNCGRQTLRTKDWACQWCGYPLISRAYKLIDKTYKELQEERSQAVSSVDADMDSEPEGEAEEYLPEEEAEPEPEPEPHETSRQQPERKRKPEQKQKPEPPPEPKKFRFFRPAQPTRRPVERDDTSRMQPPPERPVNRPAPRDEALPPPVERPSAPVFRPEPRPEPPVGKPVTPAQPLYRMDPQQELPPAAPPRPVYQPEPVKNIESLPPPVQEPARPVAPPQQHAASAPPPPPLVMEPPPAAPSIKVDDIREGMEITADDLDALFRMDKSGANLKLNGKTIILRGMVEKVFIREHLDIRYIVVTGKKRLVWSDRCTFNKEDSGKASHLAENTEVAVRGKYDGYGKNIIFKDCQVV